MLFLGIDTSNYVSSMAILEASAGNVRQLKWEKRINLEVARGGKGLRQAEAVFQHLKNMPLLWQGAAAYLSTSTRKLNGIAVSVRPRPVKGSYMPVFQVGKSFAASAASLLGVSLYEYSHQEGHIAAGLWSAKCPSRQFLSLHLSGGTTEIMLVTGGGPEGLQIKLLGGSSDLNAGQFVDRIGVKLGFSFPAGKELEKLASTSTEGGIRVPVSVKNYEVSFSGPATFVERAIDSGNYAQAEIARGVEVCIARSFTEVIRCAASDTGIKDILVVGGIAANAFISRQLVQGLPSLHFFFPEPVFAGDSAIGPALLAANTNGAVP